MTPPPPPPCDAVAFTADGRRGALEIVVRVNGEVCHREASVEGAPRVRERVGDLCALPPGENRIDVALERAGGCGERIEARTMTCEEDDE